MGRSTDIEPSADHPDNPLEATLRSGIDGPGLNQIRELDDHVEKLQDVFPPAMREPKASVRPTATVVYGPDGAGMARLGRSILTELSADGFRTIEASISESLPEEQLYRGRVDGWIADLLDDLGDKPVALLLEGLHEIHPDPEREGRGIHDAVDQLREVAPQVAVVCTVIQDHPRIAPQSTPEYFEFADLVLGLGSPSSARLASSSETNSIDSSRGRRRPSTQTRPARSPVTPTNCASSWSRMSRDAPSSVAEDAPATS